MGRSGRLESGAVDWRGGGRGGGRGRVYVPAMELHVASVSYANCDDVQYMYNPREPMVQVDGVVQLVAESRVRIVHD